MCLYCNLWTCTLLSWKGLETLGNSTAYGWGLRVLSSDTWLTRTCVSRSPWWQCGQQGFPAVSNFSREQPCQRQHAASDSQAGYKGFYWGPWASEFEAQHKCECGIVAKRGLVRPSYSLKEHNNCNTTTTTIIIIKVTHNPTPSDKTY